MLLIMDTTTNRCVAPYTRIALHVSLYIRYAYTTCVPSHLINVLNVHCNCHLCKQTKQQYKGDENDQTTMSAFHKGQLLVTKNKAYILHGLFCLENPFITHN